MATSTHNSQVIHAGIYYPAGSLKARHCVEGARLLYEFCAAHGVPHRRCGKLIVAHDDGEIPALEALRAQGDRQRRRGTGDRRCGRRPGARAARARSGGLFSPNSGILEAEALVRDAGTAAERKHGGFLLPGHGARRRRASARTRSSSPRRQNAFDARSVVNAAGLYADEVSAALGGSIVPHLSVPRRVRGARAVEARAGQRARLSAAAHAQPRHALQQDRSRQRDARPDRALSGAQGRLRRATACRSNRFSSRRDRCCRRCSCRTCGSAAAASVRSCTARTRRSPIS